MGVITRHLGPATPLPAAAASTASLPPIKIGVVGAGRGRSFMNVAEAVRTSNPPFYL